MSPSHKAYTQISQILVYHRLQGFLEQQAWPWHETDRAANSHWRSQQGMRHFLSGYIQLGTIEFSKWLRKKHQTICFQPQRNACGSG
jgi:hypothetical protein